MGHEGARRRHRRRGRRGRGRSLAIVVVGVTGDRHQGRRKRHIHGAGRSRHARWRRRGAGGVAPIRLWVNTNLREPPVDRGIPIHGARPLALTLAGGRQELGLRAAPTHPPESQLLVVLRGRITLHGEGGPGVRRDTGQGKTHRGRGRPPGFTAVPISMPVPGRQRVRSRPKVPGANSGARHEDEQDVRGGGDPRGHRAGAGNHRDSHSRARGRLLPPKPATTRRGRRGVLLATKPA